LNFNDVGIFIITLIALLGEAAGFESWRVATVEMCGGVWGRDGDGGERWVAGAVWRLQAGVEPEAAAAACAAEEVCVGGCEEERHVSEIGPGDGDVREGAEGEVAREGTGLGGG
jgi:hypothetical protein